MYSTRYLQNKIYKCCFHFVLLAADRCRLSLLVVGVMLLVCLTAIIFYLLHDFVKSKFYLFSFLHYVC